MSKIYLFLFCLSVKSSMFLSPFRLLSLTVSSHCSGLPIKTVRYGLLLYLRCSLPWSYFLELPDDVDVLRLISMGQSHDPISRIRFMVPKIQRRLSYGPISGFQFCQLFSSLKKSVEWKTEHVQFHPFLFQNLRIHVLEGHFYCVHTVWFSEPTSIGSLKSDRVNGSYDLFNFCDFYDPYCIVKSKPIIT